MIENLDDATILSYLKQKEPLIKKHSKSKINRERDRLVSSLAAYYIDRADFAVPMPSAYERAFMNRGTQDGTALGIAARLFWQFKSFSELSVYLFVFTCPPPNTMRSRLIVHRY